MRLTQPPLALLTPAQAETDIEFLPHEYLRELPPAKTINYATGIRLLKQLRAHGADECSTSSRAG